MTEGLRRLRRDDGILRWQAIRTVGNLEAGSKADKGGERRSDVNMEEKYSGRLDG